VSERRTLVLAERDPSQRGGRRGSPRRIRVLGVISGVVSALVVTAVAAWLVSVVVRPNAPTPSPSAVVPLQSDRPIVSEAGLVSRSGVRIVHVAVTGDGGLLDLRFQVIDPEKAAAVVHDPAASPAIIDEATGVVAKDLFMGHSHGGPLKEAVTYYLIFENPGNLVQRGGLVTVLLGDAQVQHVIVR
jgi:hypothetical protein